MNFLKQLVALLGLTLLVTSCSFFKSARQSLTDDEGDDSSIAKQMVSKKQYDELLYRYDELNKKYEQLKENSAPAKVSTETQPSEIAPVVSNNVETVDIFADKPDSSSSQKPAAMPQDLEAQITMLKTARSLKQDAKKQTEAMKMFQGLKASTNLNVRSRATFELGEMFFRQGEYDLALQMYEEVVNQNAASGVVIDALPKIILSCEKLGLPSKKEQYQTMYKEVFSK